MFTLHFIPAAKSSAQLEIVVKEIEAHLTTVSPTAGNKKIWLNSIDENISNQDTSTGNRDLKHETNTGIQQIKYTKGKYNSHSQNKLESVRKESDLKPIKKEKWNIHRDDNHPDDYIYWDSISGHVDDEARPTDKPEVRYSYEPCSLTFILRPIYQSVSQ